MKQIIPIFLVSSVAVAVVCSAQNSPNVTPPADRASDGHALFLKDCAHCHGFDAHGDEGPDLHNLDWTDPQIANRIRNGKAGQMTAFQNKLSQQQIDSLITYLHTLK
jgi:mono/diheme cytochrome c family protein